MKLKVLILYLLIMFVSSAAQSIKHENFMCENSFCILENVTSTAALTSTLSSISAGLPYIESRHHYHGNQWAKRSLNQFFIIRFQNTTLRQIPDALFEKFTALKVLEANDVKLEEMSRDDFKSARNLYNLSLSHNIISALQNVAFMYMKNLTFVDLSHNQISKIHDAAFDEMSSNLSVVNLSFNKIEKFPENYFLLLGKQTGLSINLESNLIDSIEQSNSSEAKTANIRFLNLQNNKISVFESSKLIIAELILNNNRVEKLNILPTVEVLHVDNNKLRELYVSSSLRNVSAINNEIRELKCDKNLSIESLTLSGNELTSGVFIQLRHASELRFLDLSSNMLGALKTDSFAEMTQLEELHLSHSGIIKISFGLFSHQNHLKILNISHNGLGFIDYHMFTTLSNLTTWDISGNNLTKLKDYEQFRDIFKSLSRIGLEENDWNCEYLSKLRLSLVKFDIKIDDPVRPVKDESSIKGIGCTTKSNSRIDRISSDDDSTKISEKLNEIVDTMNKLTLQVNQLKTNETNFRELFHRIQMDILTLKAEELKKQLLNVNTTNLNEVPQIVEQVNNLTLAKQSLAYEQLVQRMNEQTLEIAKHKLEIEKLLMNAKFEASSTSELQTAAIKSEHISDATSSFIVPTLLVIILLMSMAIIIHYAKEYLKSKLHEFRPQPRVSRRNSINTITTFDNSSV